MATRSRNRVRAICLPECYGLGPKRHIFIQLFSAPKDQNWNPQGFRPRVETSSAPLLIGLCVLGTVTRETYDGVKDQV